MKGLLIILFLLFSYSAKKEIKGKMIINNHSESTFLNYEKTLNFIKQHEGFSSTIYSDKGYDCIGHGQRIKCFKGKIPVPQSRYQADSILRISFSRHQKIINYHFGKLNKNKRLALSHLSYCRGISSLLRNNLVKNGELDTLKLLRLKNKKNRQFEKSLFYNLKMN